MDVGTTIARFVEEVAWASGKKNIGPDESLISTGILDSMALVQLIMLMEEQFGVTIEPSEVVPEKFETVNSITAFLQSKL